MEISERIKEIRKDNKMTQKDFGKELSVSASYVSRLESGTEKPTDMLLKLIALRFNVATTWLFNGTGKKDPESNFDYFDRGENHDSIFRNQALEEIENMKRYFETETNSIISFDISFIISSILTILNRYPDVNLRVLVLRQVADLFLSLDEMLASIDNFDKGSMEYNRNLSERIRFFSNEIRDIVMGYEPLFYKV